MTAPTHSPAEIRDAVDYLRGLTVVSGKGDNLTAAVRVATDAAEAHAQSLEGQEVDRA